MPGKPKPRGRRGRPPGSKNKDARERGMAPPMTAKPAAEPVDLSTPSAAPIHHEPALQTSGRPNLEKFWPKDRPLPDVWVKPRRRTLPCHKCRRYAMPDGGQAVVCTHSWQEVAFFRCRVCGHRFQLPIKEVD